MQVISTSFNMLLIPFTWSLVLKSVIILFAVFCSVLGGLTRHGYHNVSCAAGMRRASREVLTSQGPLLLLLSLALRIVSL